MLHMLQMSFLVGVGGFVGSIFRYSLGLLFARWVVTWPAGTLAANTLGCFTIGILMALVDRGALLSPATRLALATGFCGGFTTMSSFIYEVAQMMRSSEYGEAALYLGGTLIFSMTAFWVGTLLIRMLGGGGG